MRDAHHGVQAAAVDGEAGQAGGARRHGHVLRRGLHVQGGDLHARRHHVLRGQVGQGEGADEQLGGVRFQGAFLGGVPGQRDQFLRAAGGGQLLGGLHAHPADHPVRGVVQVPDERLEGGAEAALRGGDPAGHGQRAGDGPVLGHQLADDHQDDRGDGRTEDQGHGVTGGGRQAEGVERAGQQGGDRRFGEHADDQAGHGDAELGAGQLERQAADGREGAVRTAFTALRGTFEVTALDGRQRELGRDEDAAGQGQEQGHGQEEQLGHRVTSVP